MSQSERNALFAWRITIHIVSFKNIFKGNFYLTGVGMQG